ncbi:MAG: DUF1670 domain-containing protein [Candidatus Hodarchaeales archaeon]|jgi:hypothetical protein
MGCSAFVSEAIVKAVHEVYFPLLHSPLLVQPGQMLFSCTSKDARVSEPLSESEQVTVVLTLDAGKKDTAIRAKKGIIGLRHHRLCRVCNEAYSQGGLLTVEDLSYRLFNCGERTILRDLARLREENIHPPLRSTVKDIGRTISHRATIVRNWLFGDELSDLHRKYTHSFSAIENYLSTFKRVVLLDHEGYSVEQIAYMLKCSRALVDIYMLLWKTNKEKALPHRRKEILEAMQSVPVKKRAKRSKG